MDNTSLTFSKEERLCGKSSISALLASGKWGTSAHLRYCWKRDPEGEVNRLLVSVPKRFFKRAVKRNLLKRRLRESYRLQKHSLSVSGVSLMLAWTGKEIADFLTIKDEVGGILARIDKACGQ